MSNTCFAYRCARYTCLLFIVTLVSQRVNCQRRNSSQRSVVIKDIHTTVTDIYETVHKTDSFLDVNLKTISSNVAVVQSKIERVADTVDLNKVNVNLINERLLKIEDKVKNIENIVSNQMVQKFLEKMNSFETLVEKLNESIDGKLRKMNNVLVKVYEFNKDMKNVIEEAKESRNSEEDTNLNGLQKNIKEQISILGVEMRNQMNALTTNTMNLRSQVDLIGSQLLMIQDDIPKGRHSESNVDSFIRSANCPNNLSDIANAITSNHRSIMNKIESEFSKIETKVGRVCLAVRPEHNDQNDALSRDIPHTPDAPKRESKSITSIKPLGSDSPALACNRITKSVSSSSCYQFRKENADCDGIYEIALRQRRAKVYCDMTDGGGGWTVIMRRGRFGNSGGVLFNRTWDEYKNGFGELDNEFWLGNELIHLLTTTEPNELQIDLESFNGEFISIRYDYFEIGSESDDFTLKIGRPKNNDQFLDKIAASFVTHANMKFSTFDRSNSGNMVNCAHKFAGGWWFDRIKCYYAFLNAPYSEPSDRFLKGIVWQSWKNQTLKAVQMKIRTKH